MNIPSEFCIQIYIVNIFEADERGKEKIWILSYLRKLDLFKVWYLQQFKRNAPWNVLNDPENANSNGA